MLLNVLSNMIFVSIAATVSDRYMAQLIPMLPVSVQLELRTLPKYVEDVSMRAALHLVNVAAAVARLAVLWLVVQCHSGKKFLVNVKKRVSLNLPTRIPDSKG